jgi:hypothetical protein
MVPSLLWGQSFKINLSPKHDQKLGGIKSGHKRMMKYYKYHKKDSAHHIKSKDKKAKKESDSLRKADAKNEKIGKELIKRGIKEDKQLAYADGLRKQLKMYNDVLKDSTSSDSAKQVARKGIKEIAKDKVNSELAKNGHPYTKELGLADSLKRELKKWWLVMKDSTASDSTKKLARENVKSLVLAQAMRNPKFQGLYQHYKQYGQKPDWDMLSKQVPGLDTLKGVFDSTSEQFMLAAENFATQSLTHAGGLENFAKQAGELDQAKGLVKSFSDPESLKTQAKEQLKEQSVDQFAGEQKLQAGQARVTALTSKFREFTNVNGKVTGIKRTSLEGKAFRERLVLGGNFNVVSTDPFSLDLSPLVGYRMNTKFYAGLGMNYRHTFSDSLRYTWYVSPSNTSMRLFANYDVFKNFFAYTEIERAGVKVKTNEEQNKTWRMNYFVGIGRKFLIHPKVYMTMTALYNLNNENNNPTYPRKFQIRIGFQNSDLAFRKKKIHYNP